ncbi:hypothetical protein [Chamaesiphon minutus]|uniref:Uncharacterized protein n=1 Tax=Chamaesiphon minutus (strain ATCC 27169 / PCC 6605) TaxID=1173020 RepID=K9UAN6_CHAP6|nr:hypothetical protein [Chamaesiphon minutus]AFY91491.1 hypothetical protein Cha6605_0187 [Chamaesiphon minutus PCC 6605]
MSDDTNTYESVNLVEAEIGILPRAEIDRDRFVDDNLDKLDDETIIRRFAQGKKRLVINQHLRIDYAHNSLQLSTPAGDLIAIHKVAARLHYILVKKDSKYWQIIQNIISESQFIPIDTATAERGFMRYQKYDIPEGYTLRYELAQELWQTWQENQQESTTAGVRLDILILARSKWYRVQQAICTDDRLEIQTRLGLISFSLRDRIAWIAKLGKIPTVSDADLSTHQNVVNGGTDSDILGKIITKLAIEAAPDDDRNLYFDLNSTMTSSAFGQPQDSSLYDEDRSSVLTSQISPLARQLRADALTVLENYLEHGETVVRTETVCDAQGNIISEKTVSTHRGCPRWAIEAIVHWS